MSKEATFGVQCACNRRIAFPDYHWPHCPANPLNMAKVARAFPGGAHDTLLAKFSKSELEQISQQGPMADRPIAGRRKGKSNRKGSKPKAASK